MENDAKNKQLNIGAVIASGLMIHKKKISSKRQIFYFTKSKRRCLEIEYNSNTDYDRGASGFECNRVQIFYYNSFKLENLTQIKINDVPKPIIDILSYLF